MTKESVIQTWQSKLDKANENITFYEHFLNEPPFIPTKEQKEVATSNLRRERDKKELLESTIELLGGTK